MKKLCALAASLIIGVASFGAQAGDRHRGDNDHDHGRHYGHYERDRHDWHGHDRYRHVTYNSYRPVYYRPAPVYYQPVRYYAVEPVYRDRVRYYGDNDIHGSISVGF